MLLMVFLPVLTAIALCFKGIMDRTASLIACAAACLTFVCAVLNAVWGGEVTLIRLTDSLVIAFRADTVAKLFSVLLSLVFACVSFYASEYLEEDRHIRRFYVFFLVTLGLIMALTVSRNLITYYMFYELMTLLSVPLVMHDMTKEAVAAGIKYLFYSVFGASCALFGIFYIGSVAGNFEFTAGGIASFANGPLSPAALFVMILGFSVKAGMFPLHSWLPTAHPVAPAPASAVLSGVITKMGVLGIIRVIFYIAGPDAIRGTWAQTVLLVLSSLTVLMGSTMAFKEKLFKKRLAYSTVSQVSYVLLGLFTLTEAGFVGALLHVICHSLIKDTLFMCAGSVIHKTGCTDVDDLRGIGKRMPVTLWGFAIASMGLVGIPPTGGFVSKWFLSQGALSMGTPVDWLFPAVLLTSAVLTAAYLFTIVFRGFFPGSGFEAGEKCETGAKMYLPVCLLALLTVLVGLFPGVLTGLFSSVASGLF